MSSGQDLSRLSRGGDVGGDSSTPKTMRIPAPPSRWKTRLLLPLGILGALALLLLYSAWDTLMPSVGVRVVPVVIKSMTADVPGSVTVQAPGWLEPAPHPHRVPALTNGVVEELLVLEGSEVAAGEVVARLIDDDARLARDLAAAAVAAQGGELAAAEAELVAARRSLETLVGPKERVARTEAELAAAKAAPMGLRSRIDAAQAQMRATEDEYQRKARLVETEAVRAADVERLRLRLEAEQAQWQALVAEIPMLAAKVAAAEAAQDAARQDLSLLIAERRAVQLAEARVQMAKGSLRNAQAQLAVRELALARTQIRAATAGVVMRRMVEPGDTLRASGPGADPTVVQLYDPAQMQVRVDVPLADAAKVGVDQDAEVIVDALPDRVFQGRVSRLVHYADIAKNTVEVKVAVTGPTQVLKPEMLARVRFLGRREASGQTTTRERLFVPQRAVVTGGEGQQVLVAVDVVAGRGRVAVRAVTQGRLVEDGHVEITDGLRPGDRVILNPDPTLQTGSRITLLGGAR